MQDEKNKEKKETELVLKKDLRDDSEAALACLAGLCIEHHVGEKNQLDLGARKKKEKGKSERKK